MFKCTLKIDWCWKGNWISVVLLQLCPLPWFVVLWSLGPERSREGVRAWRLNCIMWNIMHYVKQWNILFSGCGVRDFQYFHIRNELNLIRQSSWPDSFQIKRIIKMFISSFANSWQNVSRFANSGPNSANIMTANIFRDRHIVGLFQDQWGVVMT